MGEMGRCVFRVWGVGERGEVCEKPVSCAGDLSRIKRLKWRASTGCAKRRRF